MRVFLDTNVLASAFATRGLCADVFRKTLEEHELIVGTCVLAELQRVLQAKFGMPQEKIASILSLLGRSIVVPVPADLSGYRVRDPADIPVLASAVVGGAEVLVTGDRDLLILGKKNTCSILSPRGFWEMLRS